jgi:hypothetical protein
MNKVNSDCKDKNYCFCNEDCYNPDTDQDELYLEENHWLGYEVIFKENKWSNKPIVYTEKILNIGNREYKHYMKDGILHNFYIISPDLDPCSYYNCNDNYADIYEEEWYHYGKLHNFYGPAVKISTTYVIQDDEANEFDGIKIGYYLYGKYYKKKNYLKEIELCKKKINTKLLSKLKSRDICSIISDYLF